MAARVYQCLDGTSSPWDFERDLKLVSQLSRHFAPAFFSGQRCTYVGNSETSATPTRFDGTAPNIGRDYETH